MGHVHADRRVEQHTGEVRGGAAAARAVLHRRVVCPGMGNEFPKIGGGKILARDQHERDFRDQRDRRKIADCVVERGLVEGLTRGVGAEIAEQELVTVRGRFRHAGGSGHPTGAADVFHHHLLPQELAHAQRQDTPDGVHRPPGGKRHHQRHRPGRPVLRCRGCGRADERGSGGNHPDDRHGFPLRLRWQTDHG